MRYGARIEDKHKIYKKKKKIKKKYKNNNTRKLQHRCGRHIRNLFYSFFCCSGGTTRSNKIYMATELVVGPLLSASIQVLFERISSWEVIDFFKRKKLSGQLLNKIKMKLSSANIVLNDAEEQQMRNPEVKKWLDELKEVIYNAEYMVDKINNKAMRSKLDGQSASQKTLLLKGCEKLRQLPTNMGRLINLRHLDITSTGLVELPHQIGKLKDLQTLTDFILGKGSTGSTLKELEDLQLLHGILRISRLENVVDVADTLMGNLKDKKFLTELQFFWDSNSEESTENHKDVLNGLQPHTNIKVLQINSYRGEQFPKWVGDNSFCNIEQIHLEGCKKCCFLPPLGQLPFLKKLCIIEFDELVKIGNEFYHAGSSMAKPFRSLEFLKFRHMREWQEWSFIGEDRVVFPNLKELYLEGCPKLTGNLCLLDTIESIRLSGCHNLDFPENHCYASLKRLKISDSCDSMKSILLDYFPKLNELDLDYCVNLESFEFSQSPRPALHSLRCFKLTTCPKFVSFPQGGLAAPNMDEFHIEDCKNFRSLPENMNTLLPSLQSISLISCPELVSFPECGLPPGINKLKVYWCNKLFTNRFQWDLQRLNSLTFLEIIGIDEELTSFPEEGLFPITLVDLHIRYLPHLKSLNGKALQQLDSLKHLSISCCNELQLLPEEGLPKSLSDLIIFQCAWLERRCQRDTGEDWSKIVHIPRVIFI